MVMKPGEIRKIAENQGNEPKKFHINHELKLLEMERTINPGNNNKRVTLQNYQSVPHSYLSHHLSVRQG
jgi:hypothetical protein